MLRREEADQRFRKVAWFWLLVGTIALLVLVVALFTCQLRWAGFASQATIFDGTVIDKRLYGFESRYGSTYTGYLLVRLRTGEELRVPVSSDVYREAQPGMAVSRATARGSVELQEAMKW